ncbi:MAG: glycosyltransferase family 2 protein [Rhizobiaceae bacterium]
MIPLSKDNSISVFTRSPGLAVESVECVVTLPTFRRPDHLLKTLESLKEQKTPRRFAVIVMENEAEEREGARAAAPLFENGRIEGLVIVAHERGNCSAYNAGWQTALMTFPSFEKLLVIDDDELAHPEWIDRMWGASESLPADIVGGPQIPVFSEQADSRRGRHPVFLPPYDHTGNVPTLYSSGNLIIGRNVLQHMGPPFLDLRFNFMGGGDSDFLSRARQAGFRLGWCAEAPVWETTPARRLDRDWIVARSLRNGVISTLVEKKKREGTPLGGVKVVAKSLALLGASPFRSIARLATGGPTLAALYPIHVALGRVMAEFGYANEQYRQPEKN